MPLLNHLITLVLFLLCIILLLLGVLAGGWQSAPFVIGVWAIAYLIENRTRDPASDSWKPYLGLPIVCILFFSIVFIPQAVAPPITRFDNLEASTGVLKKGVGGDISLAKEDGTSMSLLCRNNAGRYRTQTCLSDIPEQAYDKEVTVYHDHEYKFVNTKAFFYEIRYNGMAVVKYNDVVKSIESRRRSDERTNTDLSVMLFVSSICSIMYVWFRRRAQQSS
ncbi:MAG: hypothetical protein K2X68_07460 [Novosphingobium sp.]|nr:hypothetical protein [Novosphingobium sp.]